MGKQSALLSSDTAPQFHDHIAAVVGVFGQKQPPQFVLQPRLLCLCTLQFLLRKITEIRIMKQLLRRKTVTLCLLPGSKGLHHRLDLFQLPVDGTQLLRISINRGLPQLCL